MKWGLAKRENKMDYGLDAFRNDILSVFDDFFTFSPTTLFESKWAPTVDITEDEKVLHVKAEVPGIDEKDLTVTLENNVLTISGEKKEERKEENKDNRYIVSERRFGSFYRSIRLPEGVNADKIEAKFKNGVLNIEIPREESAQPKKIKIDVH